MAEPKDNDFLDDIDAAEADAYADEMAEIDDEALSWTSCALSGIN